MNNGNKITNFATNNHNLHKKLLFMFKKINTIIIGAVLFFTTLSVFAQQRYKIGLVGFYNLENLFDTIDDPKKNDAEFLPDGVKKWDSHKYMTKLNNMAYSISTIGTDSKDRFYSPDGVAVLGLSEMENRQVLEDLVAQPYIKDRNYQIVHYDSPDRRGIDVALIYNPRYFKLINSKSYRLTVPEKPNSVSRDQLVVTGIFDDEEMSFIVMHWPSRYGGEKRSVPNRMAAAKLCRHIADSILAEKPDAKIIMMGDFNDYPTNKSVTEELRAKGNVKDMNEDDFFNPMYELHQKGIGTNYYHDIRGVLDQTVITSSLLKTDFSTYQMYEPVVHDKEFLKQHSGRYKGYPWRTFSGGVWIGGYSDHFPVYLILLKKI